ncbi:type II toxin-antitoxin system Phd/YefM family antitoxin [Sandaracinobacteroides saxicola]|uniref:Antitoxin n=1 Tax=Sandaracinobacteroides saxicola TaxID=2759707 RepID=A0A7G5IJL4_9SPHN|nr:type II toxin-antitoxin system Phd/YefM family antitoxin [Sandaracinobacteroides saxicola]QMW23556.1 hypothetical protein H3309_03390 [Sandaracinobacteroides saxicola]
MIQVGIREFRERFSEMVHGAEPVVITNRGKRLGRFIPERRPVPAEVAAAAVRDIEAYQASLRAHGIEPYDILADLGLDPSGAPLADGKP